MTCPLSHEYLKELITFSKCAAVFSVATGESKWKIADFNARCTGDEHVLHIDSKLYFQVDVSTAVPCSSGVESVLSKGLTLTGYEFPIILPVTEKLYRGILITQIQRTRDWGGK